jgi:hypothetical protein
MVVSRYVPSLSKLLTIGGNPLLPYNFIIWIATGYLLYLLIRRRYLRNRLPVCQYRSVNFHYFILIGYSDKLIESYERNILCVMDFL